MNLGTLREKVQRTTSRHSAADNHHVMDAIESACKKYYRRKYRFNTVVMELNLNGERTHRSPDGNLDDGVAAPDTTYYFPWDLLRSLRISRISNEYPRIPLLENSIDQLSQQWTTYNTGIPRAYAWDGQDILVVRPVIQPAYPVEIHYIKDVARPIQVWEDGQWIVRDSVTKEKMDEETEGPWFLEAGDLIHWETCYEMFMGVYSDSEKAQRAKVMRDEALKELERMNAMTTGPRTARPDYHRGVAISGLGRGHRRIW